MTQPQSPTQPEPGAAAPHWLAPSAALERFVAPPDLLWNAAPEKIERKRYGFCIGAFGLLIKAEVASEVLRTPAISTLPGAPPWLLGVLNLRGNLVPVFDLALLLGVARTGQPQARLVLILDKGENAVAMLIDAFPQPLSQLAAITHLPALPARLQGPVSKAYSKDEQLWLEFDHEFFFDSLSRSNT